MRLERMQKVQDLKNTVERSKMSLNDPLASALSHIDIEDKNGKTSVNLKYNSKTIKAVLNLLRENKYLGEITEVENNRGGNLIVNLIGAINKVGVIKPRFNVKTEDYAKFEKRFMPAYGMGFLIVSTNKGLMTHEDAKKQNLGGKLIAYVY